MGRVYKSERFDDPTDATPADALTSNTYRDRRGRVVASDSPNSGISFSQYDSLGRRTASFVGTQFDSAKYTAGVFDYPDDDEGIVEYTEFTLGDGGDVEKVIRKELNHNDTNGMDLDGTDFIRTYSYRWYDEADRLTHTASYGTNSSDGWKDNSTAPTYGASAPTGSDTILVSEMLYDSSGRAYRSYGPRSTGGNAIFTESEYDDLGRVIAMTEDATSGGLKRKTEHQFDGLGNQVNIIADPSSDNTFASAAWTMVGGDVDQVTEYVYGDSQSARRVTEIRYPTGDGTSGSGSTDKVVIAYNVDGAINTRTDQDGNVLTYSYDSKRRRTEEEVTTVGSGFDDTVRARTWTYNYEGQVVFATTHTDTTPDTSTWADANSQIKYSYDAAGRMTTVEQDHDSEVGDNGGDPTKDIEIAYDTDYTSTGNYARIKYIENPSGRKIWRGYTHSDTSNTFEDTINDEFNRVGQLAYDDSGSIGDILVEYSFNGMGRMVRRESQNESGWYGNDTRVDLWHGTSGDYDGLDRFGRIVDMRFQDISGMSAVDFERRKYEHDRGSNRTVIENPIYKARSQAFGYDDLNRLTQANEGILVSSAIEQSDLSRVYNYDILGNIDNSSGLQINGATVVQHATNATNEISTLTRPNPAGAAKVINDPFTSSLSGIWMQDKGTWSVGSGQAQVDTLTGSDAVMIGNADMNDGSIEVKVTFPASSSTKKAGVIVSHIGSNSYYAVVLDRTAGKIALHDVRSGSWGAALASATATMADSTQYKIKVFKRQRHIYAEKVGESGANFSYDAAGDFGQGMVGMYADVTGTQFDDFSFSRLDAREPSLPRWRGPVDSRLDENAN